MLTLQIKKNFFDMIRSGEKKEEYREIKNISRKRALKLLLARGIQRNGANEIANFLHRKYGCYNPIQLMLL